MSLYGELGDSSLLHHFFQEEVLNDRFSFFVVNYVKLNGGKGL